MANVTQGVGFSAVQSDLGLLPLASFSEERARLVKDDSQRSDMRRHAAPFTLILCGGISLLLLVPLVPGHERLFGTMTFFHTALIIVPNLVSIVVSSFVFRRLGADSKWTALAESVEVFCAGCFPTVYAYAAGDPFAAYWLVQPLHSICWAGAKPALARRYGVLGHLPCLLGALLCWYDGRHASGAIALLSATLSALVFYFVAKTRMAKLSADAERNVIEDLMGEMRVQREIDSRVRKLEQELSEELRALARRLQQDPRTLADADHARAIATEIARLPDAAVAYAPATLAELVEQLERRCQPLGARVKYLGHSGSRTLAAATATTLVRVAQELVRNAATHARAKHIDVWLDDQDTTVRLGIDDDGRGIAAGTLDRAAGGLQNAVERLREIGGDLSIAPRAKGTSLVATAPVSSSTA